MKKLRKSGKGRGPAPVGPQFEMDQESIAAPKKNPGAKKVYFPFDVMEVGRSFTTRRALDTVRTAARRYRDQINPAVEFTARRLDDGLVRCWRLK